MQREGSLSNPYPDPTLQAKDASVEHTYAERSIPPPPGSVSDQEYHKDMRIVYLEAKMQFERATAKLRQEKKRKSEGSEDRQLEKKLKLDLAAVKARVKLEKLEHKSAKLQAQEVIILSDNDSDSEPCASIFVEIHKNANQHNVVEKWQRGHQKAALKAARDGTVIAATVNTLRDAHLRMATHGWAVMDNMTSLFHPDCRPSQAQRDFINTLPENLKEHIFEGATIEDTSPVFTPSKKDKLGAQARRQMVAKLPPVKYSEYNDKYGRQASCIIEGYSCVRTEATTTAVQQVSQSNEAPPTSVKPVVKGRPRKKQGNEPTPNDSEFVEVSDSDPKTSVFHDEEHQGMFNGAAGMAANWTIGTTTIIGGINYQHPHSDCGVVESYAELNIFPFVCLHGFGIDPYSLWLLPDALQNKYGFLYTFRPDQIIFLRGDFIHAGVPSRVPRGHFKFFPHPAAGWSR